MLLADGDGRRAGIVAANAFPPRRGHDCRERVRAARGSGQIPTAPVNAAVSIRSGADHVEPLSRTTSPLASATTQLVVDAQDTATGTCPPPSMVTGPVHDAPS